MALTWRAVLLAALGIPVVLLVPLTGTVIVWAVFVALACAVDAALAASPRQVAVARAVPASVRLDEPATCTVTLTNVGRRRLRARVRDAWPPSAGVLAAAGLTPGTDAAARTHPDRHDVTLAPGEARRVR
ncbi:lipoprotein, partial [Cellulomonas sp. A375-1]